jgi:outer membrane protein OmpA-like peptidoglycan-associated protein/tetratricopeptide (TPR) repeat protein
MKNLYLIFFTFFIATGAFAQYSEVKALGDKAFKNKDYYQAAFYYKEIAGGAYRKQGRIPFYADGRATKKKILADRPYVYYRLAESYRLYQNYREAQEWYGKTLDGHYDGNYPLTRLWFGVCCRANKKFDEAIEQLQLFITSYKNDDGFKAVARQEIANCTFAKQQYQFPLAVTVTKMDSQLNSDAGDYAIVKNNSNFWFTSSRLTQPANKHVNHIYSATAQNSFNPAMVILKGDDDKKDIEYGTPSLDATGKRLYVTRWYKDADKTVLAIYFSQQQNNAWPALKKLNSNVNADGYNAMQPFVTPDGKRLFFVSDRPGGLGGDDIWLSELDDTGNAINAVNLGKTINTPLDEQAPFYDQARKRLVYSSKGFVGLGGFDFFESFENKGQWSAPVNLGYPVNSSKDDLYYYPDPDDVNKAFISSDRGSDCCLALFEVSNNPIFIAGKLADCDSQTLLSDVQVSLVDSLSGSVIKEETTNANEGYRFETFDRQPLKLVVKKPGYFAKVIYINKNSRNDTLYSQDVCLKAFKINKPIKIQYIFYDFNKAGLRETSKIALDSLVTIMKDNPAIKIELASHTDSIGSDAYNINLSAARAQSCVDYIVSKGIDKDRLSAKGYGKSVPVAPNSLPDGKDNPEGRQLNRRTEFTVKE